jgi:hypothetical protein
MSSSASDHAFAQKVATEIVPRLYKTISTEHRADFGNFLAGQDIVKKYIQEHDCILYGGIAIDYALRLRGDKIYGDEELPDFDFFTIDPVSTAVEIVNIIRARIPGANAYAFRARFLRTMRVSVGDNNWVADISYLPPDLFATIPSLTFDGMRIVHPYFQYVDLHSSLAYPYDNSPTEVIFDRWHKDIARFTKLMSAYPLPDEQVSLPPSSQVRISRHVMSRALAQGFAAYSIYYDAIRSQLRDGARDILSAFPFASAPTIDGDDIVFDIPYRTIEVMAHRASTSGRDQSKPPSTSVESGRKFAPLLDLIEPAEISTTAAGGVTLISYSSSGRYPGYVSREIASAIPVAGRASGTKLRAISIHGLMKYFLSCYLRAQYFRNACPVGIEMVDARVYLAYYRACYAFVELSRDMTDSVRSMFDPSVAIFGDESIPLHDLIKMHLDIIKIMKSRGDGDGDDSIKEIALPPRRPNINGSDTFDYGACAIMRLSGEERASDTRPL